MSNVDYIDFQNRTEPLAYLITFRCYGTWLHGEQHGSIDRRNYHRYGTPGMPANTKVLDDERTLLKNPPIFLTYRQRKVVEVAIREVCEHRGYVLHAVNVRTNHVHSVVSAACKPEHVMDSFKSYATRRLREASLLERDVRPRGATWQCALPLDRRRGSTLYRLRHQWPG